MKETTLKTPIIVCAERLMEHSDMMRGGALMAYRITERFVLVEAILLSGKWGCEFPYPRNKKKSEHMENHNFLKKRLRMWIGTVKQMYDLTIRNRLILWRVRLSVRTPGFQPVKMSSTPIPATINFISVRIGSVHT